MIEIAVGVDIGGTNSVIGLVTCDGQILGRTSFKTSLCYTVSVFIASLERAVEKILKSVDEEVKIIGVGIGAPNGNFYDGTIEFAPNLPWQGVVHLAKDVKEKMNVPVFLTNDANAAAVGEFIYGGAKDMKNFSVITLGTGLGSGIMVNGKLLYGHDGFAGELGHVIIRRQGRECGCGRKGCLETYASARGICRTVFGLLAKSNAPSNLRNITMNELDSKSIYEAAIEGDEIALEAFKQTGTILGEALADLIALTSPEAIFLFGGLALSGDFILQPTQKAMEENLLKIYKGKVKLQLSQMSGYDAAVLGASALVWKNI